MTERETRSPLQTMREMARLQARVCYMNVDRTLASWTRSALSLIVFGTVVDRFGLLLAGPHLTHAGTRLAPNPISSVGGLLLVLFGTLLAASAAARHQGYRRYWMRQYGHDPRFGPWLAFPFALMVAVLGVVMLAVLLVFVR